METGHSSVVPLDGGPLDGMTVCGDADSPFFIIGYVSQDGEIYLSPSEDGFKAGSAFKKFAAVYAKGDDETFYFKSYNESSYGRWSFVTSSVQFGMKKQGE